MPVKRKSIDFAGAENLSSRNACQKGMLRADLYKQPFRFLLPDRQDRYRTFIGSLLSIFTFTVLTLFALYRIITMLSMEDYKIQVHELENYYDQ